MRCITREIRGVAGKRRVGWKRGQGGLTSSMTEKKITIDGVRVEEDRSALLRSRYSLNNSKFENDSSI